MFKKLLKLMAIISSILIVASMIVVILAYFRQRQGRVLMFKKGDRIKISY